MHRIVLWFALASAVGFHGINSASAEDYLLRVEELVYSGAKIEDVKQLHAAGSAADKPAVADAPQGEVAQSIELRVTPNVPFYSKTKVGEKTVTVSGTLVPGSEPGKFQLNVDRKCSEGGGRKIVLAGGQTMDGAPIRTVSIRPRIEVGKPFSFGPVASGQTPGKKTLPSTKGTFVVHTFRLEAVDDTK